MTSTPFNDPITQAGAIMKNTQIAKSGIRAESHRASARETRATKAGGEKQNAAHAVDPDSHQMISRDAYFRSKQRGFAAGSALQDWGEAEQEVLRMLSLDKRLNFAEPGN